jgi:ribosomal protein S18 acetylase RimI-like enzyme
MIRRIEAEADIQECAGMMREAFSTVAVQLGLTEENAPTNPAFMTAEKLRIYLRKPVELFGYVVEGRIIGSVAVEKAKADDGTYYMERLAVSPAHRHRGCGEELVRFAESAIQGKQGTRVSIGIINENAALKEWYLKLGFAVTSYKRFEHLPFEVCFMEKSIVPGRRSEAADRPQREEA